MAVIHEHFTTIETGAAGDASVVNAPLLTLNDAIVVEELARAAADLLLQANYEAADDDLQNTIAVEAANRYAADMAEAAQRASDDDNELAERVAADLLLQNQIDVLDATAATSGGTAFTLLTRNAGAAVIASIGGDGTTTTVSTDGTHGYVDGDILAVAGTVNYNDSETAAIDVLSTTQFQYLSPVNAATEVVGTVATKRLFVASTAEFVVNQQIVVMSDTGDLHATTVAGIPVSGQITLTLPVPTSWTLTARASIGATVGSSLPEIVAMRTAIGSDGTLTAAEALKWAAGDIQNLRAWGAVGDGVTDDRAAIMAAITAGAGSATHKTILVPPGTYRIASTTGAGRETVSLLIDTDNVRLVGAPGAEFLFVAGSHTRGLIIRNAENVRVQGISMRATGGASTAINIENSSQVVCDGEGYAVIEDLLSHGVAITEDTRTAILSSSGSSFDSGTKRITNAPGSFPGGALGYLATGGLTVVASQENDGVYTIAAVDGAGAWVQVNETLVTEAAGATTPILQTEALSFNAADKTFVLPAGGLRRWPEESRIVVAGSGLNDGTYTVFDLDPTGTILTLDEAVIDEAAGAMVTLSKVAKPSVNVQLATPCNDITIRGYHFKHIGYAGIQCFPKAKSFNHTYVFNTFYDIGYRANGPAIKAGQGVVNCIVAFNKIAHCVFGIQLVNWESCLVTQNVIKNCYYCAVAITEGFHPKYFAGFNTLSVVANEISYVDDYVSGTPFDPTISNTIDGTRRITGGSSAINVNGLQNAINGPAGVLDWGPILIARNQINEWHRGGLSVGQSLMPIPNIKWTSNTLTNCGNSRVNPMTSFGTVSSTVNPTIITAVKTVAAGGVPGGLSTAGWYKGVPIIGDPAYIQPGTVIESINVATSEITMSLPAVGSGIIGLTSTYPAGAQWEGNTWEQTAGSAGENTADVRLFSHKGRLLNNRLIGLAPYALNVKGDGMLLDGTYFERINTGLTAVRSAILIGERGTYKVFNTVVNVDGTAAGGTAAYILACIAVIATSGGLGGTISLQSANNVCTLATTQGQNGGVILPITLSNSGLRTMVDSAAPIANAWLRGERVLLNTPSAGGPSQVVVSAGGTPGTWRPTAYLVTQYFGSATWDPGSLANGATATTTVTVTGAAVGDICGVGFTSITTAGWQISGQVTSANTVTVVLTNNTGGTVDLASGTLRAKAEQPY